MPDGPSLEIPGTNSGEQPKITPARSPQQERLDFLVQAGLLTPGDKPGEYTPTPHSERQGIHPQEFADVAVGARRALTEGAGSEHNFERSRAEIIGRVNEARRFGKNVRFRPHRMMKKLISELGSIIGSGIDNTINVDELRTQKGVLKTINNFREQVKGKKGKEDINFSTLKVTSAEFNKALDTGFFFGAKVINESYDDVPKLTIQYPNGKTATLIEYGGEMKMLRADEAPEGMDIFSFEDYIQKQIRELEAKGETLDANFVFAKTRSLEAYDLPSTIEQSELQRRKTEAVNEFRYRLFMAVAQNDVFNNNKDNFIALMGTYIGKAGIDYVGLKLENKEPEKYQINLGINLLESAKIDASGNVTFDPTSKSGDYFRLRSRDQQNKIKDEIQSRLKTKLEEEARLKGLTIHPKELEYRIDTSWALANRLMDVTGMTTFYGGATDKTGTKLLKQMAVEEAQRRGIFSSGNVNFNKPEFHKILADIRAREGVRVLPTLLLDRFDEIPQTTHGLFVSVFNAPEKVLESIDEDNFAVELLPYLDTRVENMAYYMGYESLSDMFGPGGLRSEKTESKDKIDPATGLPMIDPTTGNPIKEDITTWSISGRMSGGAPYGWAASLKKPDEFISAIPEFLYSPFKNANAANDNVNKKVIMETLEPIKKLTDKANYMQNLYPPQDQTDIGNRQFGKQLFSEDIMEAAILYHDSKEGRKRHKWVKWHDNTKSAIIKDAASSDLMIIRKSLVDQLMSRSGTDANWAGLFNAWLEIREGLLAGAGNAFKFARAAAAQAAGEAVAA